MCLLSKCSRPYLIQWGPWVLGIQGISYHYFINEELEAQKSLSYFLKVTKQKVELELELSLLASNLMFFALENTLLSLISLLFISLTILKQQSSKRCTCYQDLNLITMKWTNYSPPKEMHDSQNNIFKWSVLNIILRVTILITCLKVILNNKSTFCSTF